ncbi:MAG TPA: molecular chaperone TorD family protein [Candidatus Aveggerthella excrementigallinarum]|nr:molecular chaperone TorD family protein [Candidatus Aveggerthella excrementigallinarum]
MPNRMSARELTELSQAFAYSGNTLLAPLSRTSDVGLDPAFWEAFPTFGDAAVERACDSCAHVCRVLADGADALQRADVEYAHLFVGPPKPVVPPWETAYRTDGGVGFGQAAVDVRRTLARLGLAVRNENNQYADHMGLELLCLSELCARTAAGDERTAALLEPFVREHPAGWAGEFARRVRDERPDGYYAGVTAVVEALLGVVLARSA